MPSLIFGDFEWDADKARANLQKHGLRIISARKPTTTETKAYERRE
jgi:uncharacterized DUF497 family protein